MICTFCAMLLYCLVLYFFVFKWHKYTPAPDKKLTGSTEKFNRDQLITLARIGIYIGGVAFVMVLGGLGLYGLL